MIFFILKFLRRNLKNVFTKLLLLFGSFFSQAQELAANENIQTRHIQELLLTAPEKAYEEAKKLAHSSNQFARQCREYHVANYYYTKSDYQKSKELLLALLKSIDKDTSINSQENYKDLMGMCVNKLFFLYKNLGEYNEALTLMTTYKNKIPTDRYQQQLGILSRISS